MKKLIGRISLSVIAVSPLAWMAYGWKRAAVAVLVFTILTGPAIALFWALENADT